MSPTRALRTASPWSPAETVRAVVLLAAGAVVAVAGWWGASHEAAFGNQVRWANGAVVGTLLAGYGLASWVLRGHWAVRQRRARLLPVIEAAGDVAPSNEPAAAVVAGPGMARFHRASCPMVAGRGWPTIERAAAGGGAPCGMCRP